MHVKVEKRRGKNGPLGDSVGNVSCMGCFAIICCMGLSTG